MQAVLSSQLGEPSAFFPASFTARSTCLIHVLAEIQPFSLFSYLSGSKYGIVISYLPALFISCSLQQVAQGTDCQAYFRK
jgi:hypothetical protein